MDYSRLDVPDIKRQLREQERRRFVDPELPAAMLELPRIYVAYRWENPSRKHPDGRWVLLGFAMTKRLQFPKLRRIRSRFKVRDDDVMKLMDLLLAAKLGGPGAPPSQFNPIVDRRWLNPALRTRS